MNLPNIKEIIELTDKNSITIEDISQGISNRAKDGCRSVRYFDIALPFDVMNAVITAGYKLSQEKSPVGENIIVISW